MDQSYLVQLNEWWEFGRAFVVLAERTSSSRVLAARSLRRPHRTNYLT